MTDGLTPEQRKAVEDWQAWQASKPWRDHLQAEAARAQRHRATWAALVYGARQMSEQVLDDGYVRDVQTMASVEYGPRAQQWQRLRPAASRMSIPKSSRKSGTPGTG